MHQEIAERGEERACEVLEEAGWRIRARNWRREIGEIDIIAERDEPWGEGSVLRVAFVEVKTRERSRGPLPEVRVDHNKRRKLVTLATLYLAQNRLTRCLARFDVMGVDLDTGAVRHHAAAFDAAGILR